MSKGMNGKAVVFDIGHYTLKAGYAGDDSPKAQIPSVVGVLASEKKYCIDTEELHVAKQDLEVVGYLKDGMIDDWDVFEKILDYTYGNYIKSESELHPVLMSEAPWNAVEKREKITEIMFEKYNIPAFYLAKNAALATFAYGKTNGIILDSGATHTTAVPVHNGFVLPQGIVKSPLGGDFLTMQCKQFLDSKDIEVVPPYMVAAKEVVKDLEKPKWTLNSNLDRITKSWHNYMTEEVLRDFKAKVLQVAVTPYNEKTASSKPSIHYEFPNGYNQDFGCERFQISEALFNPSFVQGADNSMLGVAQVVTTSVEKCDNDMKKDLYGSIILTGGNTLLQGFPERLSRDLSAQTPQGMKIKIISTNTLGQSSFGAWNGGSLFAVLDAFQQMSISKQEYAEGGKALVGRKCP